MGTWGAFSGVGATRGEYVQAFARGIAVRQRVAHGLGDVVLPEMDLTDSDGYSDAELDAEYEATFGGDNVSHVDMEDETVEGDVNEPMVFEAGPTIYGKYDSGRAPYSGSGNRISSTSAARGGSAGSTATGPASDFGAGVADFFGSLFKGVVGVAEGAVRPSQPTRRAPTTPSWVWWVAGGVGAVAVVSVVALAVSKK